MNMLQPLLQTAGISDALLVVAMHIFPIRGQRLSRPLVIRGCVIPAKGCITTAIRMGCFLSARR
jgi:hypothetical protein